MSEPLEVEVIPHCDEPSCDLGVVKYQCPWCDKRVSDYDVWFDHEKPYWGKVVDFTCADCREPLRLRYQDGEGLVVEKAPSKLP